MTKAENRSRAVQIVEAIEDDITDRRGLKNKWHAIDDDVLATIRADWITLICKILDKA